MIDYTQFLPLVIPFATDCPDLVAVAQVRSAAIEFCSRSGCAKYDFPTTPVAADQETCTLVPPTGQQIEGIYAAYYDDWPLITGPDDLMARRYGVDWRIVTGVPRFLWTPGGEVVRMVPIPEVASTSGLSVRATLTPTQASTQCMDIVFQRYAEAVAAGALARLYAIPGQSFTAPAMIGVRRAEFESGVNRAKVDVARGMARTRMVARPHPGNL